ncbi:hypothetical protein F9802_04060 [Bacillus aerolatus]|uniref:Uncharacterized protein n=1 Tax=Bacillus aerolatus TaxID=2653354 RepID=A0A6I1FHL2_9BACI|nr:hypothetical protein [Bacillus aerolatus]KAB7707897.1 hypothetical protein F9802_04060 [Bacillus aerolatus]
MGDYLSLLILAVVAVAVVLILYTVKVLKQQSVVKAGMDEPIPKNVQQHPYVKNPVFWAYLIGAALILGVIFYFAAQW